MKYIIDYLYKHLSSHQEIGFFVCFFLFLGGSMYVRYALGFDVSFSKYSIFQRFFFGFLFYGLAYFGAIFLYVYFFKVDALKNQFSIFYQSNFWVLSALILGVLVINQYGLWYLFYKKEIPKDIFYFTQKTGYNLQVSIFYLLIPFIYGYFSPLMRESSFYGVRVEGFHYQPYLYMLLSMLPLLVWASYQASFLEAYPRYKFGQAEAYWGISPYVTVTIFELSYVLQFIALEIFFRGFMVMALGQFLGHGAVFPMVSVYCFLHFFKPMPETLGSIFGGYILGVIAFYSHSTFGGMCIHVGIALLMELLAGVQIHRK